MERKLKSTTINGNNLDYIESGNGKKTRNNDLSSENSAISIDIVNPITKHKSVNKSPDRNAGRMSKKRSNISDFK